MAMKTLSLLLFCLWGTNCLAEPPASAPLREIVIEPTSSDFPRSDAASIARLADGRLMMVYQKSYGGSSHDGGYKRICSLVSNDEGLTWKEPRSLIDAAEGYVYAAGPSLLRLKSGALLLSCVGLLKDAPLTTQFLFRSDDDGKTFQPMHPIWDKDQRSASQGGATSLIQLESGRLILPVCCYLGPELADKKARRNAPRSAWCFYSDDGGRTWRQSSTKAILDKRGALEPSIAQMADGRLIMSLRTQLGGPYLSFSADQGAHWSAPVFSGLEGGESCTCIRRIPGTSDLVLLWNNCKYIPVGDLHFGKRTPLTSALSRDNGKTWADIRNLAADPAAEYTNLDCFFTNSGGAIVTYGDGSSVKERLSLHAILVPPKWFYGKE